MVWLLQFLPPPPPPSLPKSAPVLPTGLPAAPRTSVSVAAILKSNAFLELMVPPPTSVPTAGTTASKLVAWIPSGAIRTLLVIFWISRSFPDFTPVSDEIADSLDPRSNPASFALKRPTVPAVTILSVGPERFRSSLSVPSSRDAPFGKLIPRAGKNACKSFTGRFCPLTLICKIAPSLGTSYVPDRFVTALPIFNVDGSSTPVFLTRSYFVWKLIVTGIDDGVPPATSSAFDSFAL